MFSMHLFPKSMLVISLALYLGIAESFAREEKLIASDIQRKREAPSRIPADSHSALAFSPDGRLLATAEGSLHLYDTASGRLLARLEWPQESSRCRHLTFSPDSRHIVSVLRCSLIGKPDSYFLWEVSPEKKLRRVAELLARNQNANDYFTGVYLASFSPDGRSVVAGSADETIYVWDCDTAKERLRLRGGVAAAFSADGQTLLAVSHDGLIQRFDAASGKPLAPPKDFARSDYIFTEGVAFARSGNRAAVWDHNQVLLQDTTTGKRIGRLTFPDGCSSAILSDDGRILIVSDYASSIWFFDATTAKELGWRKGRERWYGDGGLAVSPDGRTFACVENEKHVKFQSLQEVLASGVKGQTDPQSDPPDVPLQAELIARQDRFIVNLGKLTAEEFSRKLTRSIEPEPDDEPSEEELVKKEIERKLNVAVSFNFKNTPFRQVVEDLRTWTGINLVVDKPALEQEKISMDQPVELKPDSVTLRSALGNFLHPMGLTCVVEEEALKITTKAHAKGRSVLKIDQPVRRIIACPDYTFPSEPRVDLEFQVRNTGKQALTFFADLDPSAFLAGPGALNISWPCQTFQAFGQIGGSSPVKSVTLEPGQKYSVRVTDLKFFKPGSQCLWICPGEYSIYASCSMSVSPAPKGAEPLSSGSGWITLRCPPLKVKVVNEAETIPQNESADIPWDSNDVRITIRVPENADIWFNGEKTVQKGTFRDFVSPQLPEGKYSYEIKARWMENGREVTLIRKLEVIPGDLIMTNMTHPSDGDTLLQSTSASAKARQIHRRLRGIRYLSFKGS